MLPSISPRGAMRPWGTAQMAVLSPNAEKLWGEEQSRSAGVITTNPRRHKHGGRIKGNRSDRARRSLQDDKMAVAHRPPAADVDPSLTIESQQVSRKDKAKQSPITLGKRHCGRPAAVGDSMDFVREMVETEACDIIARGRYEGLPVGGKHEQSTRKLPQINLSGSIEFVGAHPMNWEAARYEAFYRDLLKREPTNLKALRDCAVWLHEVGRLAESEKIYKQALKLSSVDAEVVSAYAILLWDMGKRNKARDTFQLALEHQADHIPSLLNYGLSLFAMGSKPVALLQFRRVLGLDINHPRALLYCAITLEDLDRADMKTISELYARSTSLDPRSVEGLHAYARFLKTKMLDFQGAQDKYEQALAVKGDEVDVLCSYGALLSERTPPQLQWFVRAEECFKLALETKPESVDVLYNYAVLLCNWDRKLEWETEEAADPREKTSRLQLAEKLYKKALALRPEDADVLCSYSIFLLENDHRPVAMAKAEKMLRSSLNAAPKHHASCMTYARFLREHKGARGERTAHELENRVRGQREREGEWWSRRQDAVQAVKKIELTLEEGGRDGEVVGWQSPDLDPGTDFLVDLSTMGRP